MEADMETVIQFQSIAINNKLSAVMSLPSEHIWVFTKKQSGFSTTGSLNMKSYHIPGETVMKNPFIATMHQNIGKK
jgi:hypothetical protein